MKIFEYFDTTSLYCLHLSSSPGSILLPASQIILPILSTEAMTALATGFLSLDISASAVLITCSASVKALITACKVSALQHVDGLPTKYAQVPPSEDGYAAGLSIPGSVKTLESKGLKASAPYSPGFVNSGLAQSLVGVDCAEQVLIATSNARVDNNKDREGMPLVYEMYNRLSWL